MSEEALVCAASQVRGGDVASVGGKGVNLACLGRLGYQVPPWYAVTTQAFDEVLGFVHSLTGQPGFTGTLTVRYRKPTPLHTPLRFDGEVDRTERRKVFASGRLFAGETLCAEAEALFISAKPGKLDELHSQRDVLEDRLARDDR